MNLKKKIKMKTENEYTLKDTMSHTDIVGFIKPWMKKKNVYTRIYNYTMMAGLFLVGAWAGIVLSQLSGLAVRHCNSIE